MKTNSVDGRFTKLHFWNSRRIDLTSPYLLWSAQFKFSSPPPDRHKQLTNRFFFKLWLDQCFIHIFQLINLVIGFYGTLVRLLKTFFSSWLSFFPFQFHSKIVWYIGIAQWVSSRSRQRWSTWWRLVKHSDWHQPNRPIHFLDPLLAALQCLLVLL